MKKILAAFLGSVIALGLTACTEGGKRETPNDSPENSYSENSAGSDNSSSSENSIGSGSSGTYETPSAPTDPKPEENSVSIWDILPEVDVTPESEFDYELSEELGGIVVTGYTGESTEVRIPDTVAGKPVKGIILENFGEITELIMPDSITKITVSAATMPRTLKYFNIPKGCPEIVEAFKYCKLTGIYLPEGVTEIPEHAFNSCRRLTDINIPNSVTKIGRGAFYDCVSLQSITIPSRVTEIDRPCGYCQSLTSIEVDPDNPNFCSVDGILFNKDKTKLITYPSKRPDTSYDIPDSVTEISEDAFHSCKGLTSVTVPDGVTEIAPWTFNECTNLKSLTLPKNLTKIGDAAFNHCKSLEDLVIPDSVNEIGEGAFCVCAKLKSIIIPNGVTTIDIYTFSGCHSLKSVSLPDSVTEISEWAYGDTYVQTTYKGKTYYNNEDLCNAINNR